jgi:hypothetical protein
VSQFGRQAGDALETFFSGDTRTDSQRAVLVVGKQVMQSHRGVPWQLYCQVCSKLLPCLTTGLCASRAVLSAMSAYELIVVPLVLTARICARLAVSA